MNRLKCNKQAEKFARKVGDVISPKHLVNEEV